MAMKHLSTLGYLSLPPSEKETINKVGSSGSTARIGRLSAFGVKAEEGHGPWSFDRFEVPGGTTSKRKRRLFKGGNL